MTEPAELSAGWAERSVALAGRFVRLADTLVDDFDVLDLMNQLVESCLELVPAAAAGLLLRDSKGELRVAASSCEASRLLELWQMQKEEGPCLDSISAGQPVVVDHLSGSGERWPQFANAADALGFASAYAFPLRHREQTVGGLNLFCSDPAALAEADRRVTQALADTATIGLLQHQARDHATRTAEQLQGAFNSRVVIEQAKGVLAQYAHVEMAQAFEALRKYSRDHNARLSEVARAVVRRTLPLDALLDGRSSR